MAYYETKKHSDTMFAFNIYPCTIPLDFSFVPLHWQDSVEIIYIKQGSGEVRIDTETYRAKAGDVFLILPGHIHGLSCSSKARMEYENIIFDMEFLGLNNIDLCSRRYLKPIIEGKLTLPVYISPEYEWYHSFVEYLDRVDTFCFNKQKGYEIGVKGLMLSAFSMLLLNSGEKEGFISNIKSEQKIKHVLKRIEEDYDKVLTVEQMAEECGYSASHFMRWFKENTGFGFNGYLIEYRLNHAAEELRNSDATILDIAGESGFDNLSNFNRLFKKRFHKTPSEFRKTQV